ncbi:hypothetical protein ACG7TL_005415 [Trametes sanguinea]
MRILDGMVNNYNPTILEAMRCNMDIQYIGSGEEAKAVLYYIKDCITKSPLKAHVAYAALELAMKKLADNGVTCADGSAEYTRRLLQQTAFSILSSQELSAQQVMSYLLDFEDHFTSHKFANLYWPSFERLIDKSFPLNIDVPVPQVGDNDNDDNVVHDDADVDELVDDDEDGEEVSVSADEVRITAAADGLIIQLSNQLADYVYRGDALSNMSLWDFVADTRKDFKLSSRKPDRTDDDAEDEVDDLSSDKDIELVENLHDSDYARDHRR